MMTELIVVGDVEAEADCAGCGSPAARCSGLECAPARELRQRVCVAMAEGAANNPDFVPDAEHGMTGGVKWRVDGDDPDDPGWEGGYLCHCGDLFVRTVAQGGITAAFQALVEHQGGTIAAEASA